MGYRGSRGAKLIPAKLKRMANGRYKVFVAPGAVARMQMNPAHQPKIFKAGRDFWGLRYFDAKQRRWRTIYADTHAEAVRLLEHGYRQGYIER